MYSITVPADRRKYPVIADESVMAVRMKLDNSRLSVSYTQIPGGILPVVGVDFFNEKGKLYTLNYHLPPDTREQTDRRVSLLMRLIEKAASQESAGMSG
ncbi:hypothetical protein [Pantoea sp. App145]|uniref:hypothetical protein n=1 Tax=Pantoea sp. App145 TaxID=3071567 RepID=UPI003A7FDE24